jgi:hypothetical protein
VTKPIAIQNSNQIYQYHHTPMMRPTVADEMQIPRVRKFPRYCLSSNRFTPCSSLS